MRVGVGVRDVRSGPSSGSGQGGGRGGARLEHIVARLGGGGEAAKPISQALALSWHPFHREGGALVQGQRSLGRRSHDHLAQSRGNLAGGGVRCGRHTRNGGGRRRVLEALIRSLEPRALRCDLGVKIKYEHIRCIRDRALHRARPRHPASNPSLSSSAVHIARD